MVVGAGTAVVVGATVVDVVVVGVTVVVLTGATGDTVTDGSDKAPIPAWFQAETWNWWEDPGSSPTTTWEGAVEAVSETSTLHSPPSTLCSIR